MTQAFIFLPPEASRCVQSDLLVRQVSDGVSEILTFEKSQMQLDRDWVMVLPVEAVMSCAVNLPTRKARWLRQALPFAVEELLAEDVELMHLTLGEQLADGRHRVFAIRRGWLKEWIALCSLAPQAIVVDADLLPRSGTALLRLHDRWILGGENIARIAFQVQDWPQLSTLCVRPHNAWRVPQCETLQSIDESISVADPFVWLAEQPLRNNLAQSEFAAKDERTQWNRWRPLFLLLCMWMVLQWSFNLAQSWHLQRQADVYASDSTALYRKLFPEDHKLVNIRAQFDQHLQAGTGNGRADLLRLLALVGDAIPDEAGKQVKIRQVDFSEARGDMAMQVEAPGFAELEKLRERLQQNGLNVQLGSASREGVGVSARVVIGE